MKPSTSLGISEQAERNSPGFWMLRALVAGVGGAIAAAGWLPPHSPVLLVLGVAFILHACRNALGWKEAVFVSFIGALVFFAISNRPLVSAYGWGGWANDGGAAIGSSGWWLLNSLWVLISLWCALFWTAALSFYWKFRVESAWIRIVGAAIVWGGAAEWLRSISHWGFEWGFLGLALVDVSALRQWSSVGGVLLLSSLVFAAAALLVELLNNKSRQRLALGVGGLVAGAIVWLVGTALEPSADKSVSGFRVAAFQFAPPVPPAGTTALGLSPAWFSALPEVVNRGYRLIVLPESISSLAVQLDGVPASKLGRDRQVHADAWKRALAPLLPNPDTFIAVGIEGIERGDTYNSTSVWNSEGLVGWQHKVNLVPFAEYLPRGWGFIDSQALTHYQAGEQYRPIDAGPFRIGSFICQEIQHADTARELTRRGANILITGGNDGVFADQQVAQVHHSMARIRATEVGRFVVRAMKNGVTSIISPGGEVIGSSPAQGPALVAATVSLPSNQTLWTRIGAWPVLLGTLGFLAALARISRRHKE